MQPSTPRSDDGDSSLVRTQRDADGSAGKENAAHSSGQGDYTVGYGRPPEGNRFKPGRSGNPQGRPRGHLAFKTLLQRELAEHVAVKEQGRRRKLSKRGVIVKRLVSEAMAGSPKHLAMVLAQDPVTAEVLDEVTAALARPADATVKADLIRRLRAVAAPEELPTDEADGSRTAQSGGSA